MNKIALSTLYAYNFSVDVINALRQTWKTRQSFSCIGEPKKANLLLYLHRCAAEYTLKNGDTVIAPAGSLVYTPQGCEYKVRIFDLTDDTSATVGINFLLWDTNRKPFILCGGVQIFTGINCKKEVDALEQISSSATPSPAKMKASFYAIFSQLCQLEKSDESNEFSLIQKGIDYMEKNPEQRLTIPQVAELCNISESYFRRLFKSYAGVSPVEYRMHTKIEQAKKYLLYDNLTTEEIAELLGFTDASYFCRQFYKRTGMTPFAYKRQHI